ncbi:hypothetical protein LO772_28260 [Yinghuangia sp. ASG 101]|uniref:hypothetical protein n=1 Tax=Yinghuangia sp. ASG 101 TaxID=2896848 RepID=UPI001E4D90B0|nr:hypothetical protein [Yinghuangia sp. ASG 101]UGQ10687.1 hypothetical protein LO772_28260 [Yinghuangia sp. ASG 101]
MADEHTVSGDAHNSPELPESAEASPISVGVSAAGSTAPEASPGALIRVGPPAQGARKSDVNNSVVLVLAVIILAFTGISGVSIWAAARFDGGRPGITAPADGHREEPVIAPAARTVPPAEADPIGAGSAGTPPGAPGPGPEAPGAADGARDGAQTDRGSDRAPAVVDWSGVRFPMECHGMPYEVRDARPLAADNRAYVVVVRCGAGSGTAPDALYTYDVPAGGVPTLASTLIGVGDNHLVKSVEVRDGAVHATLLGWSTDDIPRCCPDVEEARVFVP